MRKAKKRVHQQLFINNAVRSAAKRMSMKGLAKKMLRGKTPRLEDFLPPAPAPKRLKLRKIVAGSNAHSEAIDPVHERFEHAVEHAARKLLGWVGHAGNTTYKADLEAATEVFKHAALLAEREFYREMRSIKLVDK